VGQLCPELDWQESRFLLAYTADEMRIKFLLAASYLALTASAAWAAAAVPEASHVRLDARALRLRVNDYLTRTQFRLEITATAPAHEELAGLACSRLTLLNAAGHGVQLEPRKSALYPRKFKAANARLQFRAVEDSENSADTNVPVGFFAGPGPYSYVLALGHEEYRGEFSFQQPLQMAALQDCGSGATPVRGFTIASAIPLRVETTPQTFGPVYYKRQDLKNFVFQLANMDEALLGGSYHPPVESPRYTFQVRVGDATGDTALLDPSRYIAGHQPFLIRSDQTTMPVTFSPEDFAGHKALLIDFIRTDTAEPDAGFSGPSHAARGWSGQLIVQDRVLYALYIDSPASSKELAGQASEAGAEDEG
jgi:hypothetical protein